MSLIVFSIYVFVFLLTLLRSPTILRPLSPSLAAGVMTSLSLLAFGQKADPSLVVLGILFLLMAFFTFLKDKWTLLRHPLFPLGYAASLITLHNALGLHILGVSYMVMSSARDLADKAKGIKVSPLHHFLNIFNFPKALVGPITRSQDHFQAEVFREQALKLATFGLIKCFILSQLWVQYTPQVSMKDLGPFFSKDFGLYTWFALSKYVYVYLEFSGLCDLVAGLFMTLGFACPLNFRTPYFSTSISEFWKRWHVTLGLWIRNHIYIPLGGSRAGTSRMYFNLVICMLISGVWHAPTWNFAAWGLIQGTLMSVEKHFSLEDKLKSAPPFYRVLGWAYTQIVVTYCWLLFFY